MLQNTIVFSQQVALRNNLLYDATLTPNLGIELSLSPKWSLGANAGLNLWDIDEEKNKKWRHLMVSPFLRHYNTTLFQRSFWSIHTVYSHYNVGAVTFPFGIYPEVKNRRLQGDLVGIGGSYGYNWRLSQHWHFEVELGLAAAYTWYKEFDCPHCGTYYGPNNKPFLLPKLGLNLVWVPSRRKTLDIPRLEGLPVVADDEPIQPIILILRNTAENTGMAGRLQQTNPVLAHISQYRPYDRTRILRKEKDALYVHYPLGKHILHHDFRGNGETLDRIVDITRQIMADSTSDVRIIQLIGLASIEGAVGNNEKLATNRAIALKEYLQRQVATPDSLYEVVGGGEAWAEFRDQLMELYNNGGAGDKEKGIPDIDPRELSEAIDIIDNEPDADKRERRLRKMKGGRPWQYFKRYVLADQRNSGYIRIYYDYVPDTDAAIINEASDLLRTECDDCHRKALAMLLKVRHDKRAQNALGVAYYLCGRHEEAIECFRQAAENGSADARDNLMKIEKMKK